jgi:hypothetical protein
VALINGRAFFVTSRHAQLFENIPRLSFTPLPDCSMGRKSSRITRISCVAVEMLKESSQHVTATSDEAPPSVDSIATQREIKTPDAKKNSGRPVKRRKISAGESTSIVGREDRYDATGLVSRYTNAHEVPDHLKKCRSINPVWSFCMFKMCAHDIQTSPNGNDTSLSTTKDVCWMKWDGTASPLNA